ncbi:MAG: helix-turn-helix transcriptional regulator, partial [Coriobacteriia bacterium]|nr:helix-turn-helix transcriptional regulator [Coriobacteriia bacterium]
EDKLRAELAQTRREQVESVYDKLAGEYALSAREREVMGMLAEGYTRAYIREALGVSDGTAKAHIAHIYQKLDVHRKDDLLAFIDAEVSRAEVS